MVVPVSANIEEECLRSGLILSTYRQKKEKTTKGHPITRLPRDGQHSFTVSVLIQAKADSVYCSAALLVDCRVI